MLSIAETTNEIYRNGTCPIVSQIASESPFYRQCGRGPEGIEGLAVAIRTGSVHIEIYKGRKALFCLDIHCAVRCDMRAALRAGGGQMGRLGCRGCVPPDGENGVSTVMLGWRPGRLAGSERRMGVESVTCILEIPGGTTKRACWRDGHGADVGMQERQSRHDRDIGDAGAIGPGIGHGRCARLDLDLQIANSRPAFGDSAGQSMVSPAP
jgi:hypothetical protein